MCSLVTVSIHATKPGRLQARPQYRDAATQTDPTQIAPQINNQNWENIATKTLCWVAILSCKWTAKAMITSIYKQMYSNE